MCPVLSSDSDKCEDGKKRREKGECVWRWRVWNFCLPGRLSGNNSGKGLKGMRNLVTWISLDRTFQIEEEKIPKTKRVRA